MQKKNQNQNSIEKVTESKIYFLLSLAIIEQIPAMPGARQNLTKSMKCSHTYQLTQ